MPKTMADVELLTYSTEHVYYEVKMFFWLAVALARRTMTVRTATPDNALWIRNTLIEGFAIHLRNLLEFIFLNYPKGGHIIAAQFCQPEKWTKQRPALSETLKKSWERADKQVAHLLSKRIAGRDPGKRWNFIGIADETASILCLLVSNAEPCRFSHKVARVLKEYEAVRRRETQGD